MGFRQGGRDRQRPLHTVGRESGCHRRARRGGCPGVRLQGPSAHGVRRVWPGARHPRGGAGTARQACGVPVLLGRSDDRDTGARRHRGKGRSGPARAVHGQERAGRRRAPRIPEVRHRRHVPVPRPDGGFPPGPGTRNVRVRDHPYPASAQREVREIHGHEGFARCGNRGRGGDACLQRPARILPQEGHGQERGLGRTGGRRRPGVGPAGGPGSVQPHLRCGRAGRGACRGPEGQERESGPTREYGPRLCGTARRDGPPTG